MGLFTRMRSFVSVVDNDGFSAAARKTGQSKALLSKHVRELEDKLGVLLLNRTTRQLSLTQAGQLYYLRAQDILREIDQLSDSVAEATSLVKGKVKISLSHPFVSSSLGQVLIDFCLAHPTINLDLYIEDRFVDLVEEGFDLAIRSTRLDDSSLVARKLMDAYSAICASPEFLQQYGIPKTPEDLINFPCLVDRNNRKLNNWAFYDKNNREYTIAIQGPIEVNSPFLTRNAAMSGLGLAYLPNFIIYNELTSGKLIEVLQDYRVNGMGIFAVYPNRRYLPTRVRLFLDFMVKWFRDYKLENNNKL